MRINTSRFGEIDIADEKLIEFADGIPGFDGTKQFALISSEDTEPFHWLQAVDEPDISLCVINPFSVVPDYAPRVPEALLAEIGSPINDDVLLLTVAVIPAETARMTTNLMSPILINAKNNQAKQVILEDGEYPVRRPIYEAVCALLNGGGPDVGADPQA